MITLLAVAWAGGRGDGEALERAADYGAALGAYEACAAAGPDLDRRFCAVRVAVLSTQAADGFAGWRVLESVRANYTTLGSDEALARIEAALRAMPDSPAGPSMKIWIANEQAKRGNLAPAAVVAADPNTPQAARGWLDSAQAAADADRRRRGLALVGGALAGVYAVVGWRRPGPLAGRCALLAGVLLGLVPAALAGGYGEGHAPGFLYSGAVVTLCVLAAPRVPLPVSLPGTVGALVATAWWNGWLPSLGL